MLNVSRANRSVFSQWWWTVDLVLVAAILLLVATGFVFSMAASPPVAIRLGLDEFHFVSRQAMFMVPALALMFVASLLSPKQMRRVCLIVFVGAALLMVYSLIAGVEIKGARRWVDIFGFRLQPSEFAKPAFVVLAAWLFAEGIRNKEMPGAIMAGGLMTIFAVLLILQPDFGQTLLVAIVWGAMFFVAGMPWIWISGFAAIGLVGIGVAYLFLPHVTDRIDRFLVPGTGDTFQVDTALSSFLRGGWFGRGPGEGIEKRSLPDSHTDFVFAVAAEEFGIIICLLLVALFAFIVLRVLIRVFAEEDDFTRFATTGLISMFGLQALINMAVNLQLIPAKGMTLPFISSGGSSLLSMSLAMGMVLGLTRHNRDMASLINLKPIFARNLFGVGARRIH
ncbi:MAG: putative lipid II flippase FtsW [Rhizobiales bacterium]|nr:putative lipid II flippase FtsW [Hyphomicrobiales bacterium]